jgi:ABC-type glutathione transport system ATPase component
VNPDRGVRVAAPAASAGQAAPPPDEAADQLRLASACVDSASLLMSAEEIVVDYHLGRGRTLRAVDHVSFELRPGEVLGIVGESGSGKSTLGKVVAGFIRPDHGRVLVAVNGSGLTERAERHPRGYRDVQMVFQESAAALNPRLPVWKLIGESARPDRMLSYPWEGARTGLRDLVLAQLGHYGLSRTLIDKRPAELSGGEKQRVAVARAMLASPAVVVCDEAVSSLDVSIRAVVLNLFKRLRDETGVALLFISHDIAVVAHLADRIMVMRHGKNVETGATAQVIDEPRDAYTRELLAAVPRLER